MRLLNQEQETVASQDMIRPSAETLDQLFLHYKLGLIPKCTYHFRFKHFDTPSEGVGKVVGFNPRSDGECTCIMAEIMMDSPIEEAGNGIDILLAYKGDHKGYQRLEDKDLIHMYYVLNELSIVVEGEESEV